MPSKKSLGVLWRVWTKEERASWIGQKFEARPKQGTGVDKTVPLVTN